MPKGLILDEKDSRRASTDDSLLHSCSYSTFSSTQCFRNDEGEKECDVINRRTRSCIDGSNGAPLEQELIDGQWMDIDNGTGVSEGYDDPFFQYAHRGGPANMLEKMFFGDLDIPRPHAHHAHHHPSSSPSPSPEGATRDGYSSSSSSSSYSWSSSSTGSMGGENDDGNGTSVTVYDNVDVHDVTRNMLSFVKDQFFDSFFSFGEHRNHPPYNQPHNHHPQPRHQNSGDGGIQIISGDGDGESGGIVVSFPPIFFGNGGVGIHQQGGRRDEGREGRGEGGDGEGVRGRRGKAPLIIPE